MSDDSSQYSANVPSLAGAFVACLRRELLLCARNKSQVANPLIFFVIVCSLFPIGIGPAREQLAQLAPGIIWVVALLATLLSTEAMFRSDYDDGSLEMLLMSPQPLYFLCLAKALAHWLFVGLPLVLVSPLLALILFLPGDGIPALLLSLFLGTGTLAMIGAIGAALTVGLRRGGVLLSLLILPLYIPVLIFGSSAVKNAVLGVSVAGQQAVLAALLLAALALAPLAIGGALRISVEN